MDELLHFFKTKDVTNAPNILQGEPTYLPFTMRAKTLLECISTGLDKTSCTATAQIIAYWLTGKKRVFGELMEGGLQLSQWNYEDVWLAPSPQLISIDMNSHKFSVVVLPTVGQAILLQSNQWPGEKYTYDQWIRREGFCSTLPHFIMDRASYREFMMRLLAGTPEETKYLFGVDYKWTLYQAKVRMSEISASVWSENSLDE
jgi:hypothetical protein